MDIKRILNYRIKIPNLFTNIFNIFRSLTLNRGFQLCFLAIFLKTLFFLVITSSDTGTGVNFKTIFYSMPPLLVYFSFFICFLSFSLIFKGRLHIVALYTLNILITFIILGDLLYYRANGSFLSIHLINYTSNLDNLGSSIYTLFRPIDLIFAGIDIVLLIYMIIVHNAYTKFKGGLLPFSLVFLVGFSYLFYAHIKIDKLNRGFFNQTIFVNSWAQNQTMSNLTPIGFHLFDTYNYIKDMKSYTLSNEEKSSVDYFFNKKAEILPTNEYKGMFKGKNLIILQVESLENFVIGQSIGGTEITPNINKLLNNSIYFNNFIEQTHLGTTSDAELMTNTSVFPVRRGSTFFRFPSNTYESSLPNLMESMGYSTLALHPDRGSYWNWMNALTSIGFDNCIDSTKLDNKEMIGLGISDRSFLNQLPGILKEQKEPFYTFAITLTSHTPFSLPKEYVTVNTPNFLKGKLLGSYIESIHYTDDAIGRFINDLEKNNMLDNSVVVIYGDHEGPHKYFKDDFKSTDNLDEFMINNNSKVPFIIYSKGMEGKTIPTLSGQIDILPTLSYLMGVDEKEYSYSSFGRNILNTNYSFTYNAKGDILNETLPNDLVKLHSKSIYYSDILIRSNYFKKGDK
ncbi:MAG: LTA synthase family protein [Clostridium sp.]|uniref:LTA synthase family protein n=1 Tax=Clostridium sp. TaxID=1506 RepID=UPI002FCA729E